MQTLGGASGDLRRRLLHFHLPLAVASALLLFLFMTLPAFDPYAYPQADTHSGALPLRLGEGETHGGGGSEPMDRGGGPAARMDHGGGPATRMDHGEGPATRMDHAGGEAEPLDFGRGQAGATDHDGGEAGAAPPPDAIQRRTFISRLTFGTGYVATGLLALTLLVGPANLLLRRRNPVSSYLRRDVGTWTAVASVVHTIFGLQAHGTGRLSGALRYFVAPDGSALLNSFGLANWTGLLALVLVVGLLAISNDFALRRLKAGPWKRLQRLNYALFALVAAHAFFYGALVRMTSPFTLLLAISVIAVLVAQAVGVWLWRRRSARSTAATA